MESSDKLVIAERVITAGLLAEKLRNEKTIVVSPKAVLTPTALELIKQRHHVTSGGCLRGRKIGGAAGVVRSGG
ncbi:MAG: hypothetical protein U0903_15295 [Planctomycetales bacterium]